MEKSGTKNPHKKTQKSEFIYKFGLRHEVKTIDRLTFATYCC